MFAGQEWRPAGHERLFTYRSFQAVSRSGGLWAGASGCGDFPSPGGEEPLAVFAEDPQRREPAGLRPAREARAGARPGGAGVPRRRAPAGRAVGAAAAQDETEDRRRPCPRAPGAGRRAGREGRARSRGGDPRAPGAARTGLCGGANHPDRAWGKTRHPAASRGGGVGGGEGAPRPGLTARERFPELTPNQEAGPGRVSGPLDDWTKVSQDIQTPN
ncbi:translation initiation factor IF-2-like isoform X1 [Acinonyx jubatus]|uniref:Translation initiation factor IF-2-like isoform X1 n=1 Tax=Acinonyx jubatus TaxID=32536 RepID=A0ABM3QFG3_ACIJB|nr:translation initiation factor IF-2-like isoform X1 [Acinonyx jubatus]XP_053082666.1 translation initiation factor IF-2-like isoform X1 [Acinonyx jubatus]